jgi:hypothetical protein
MHWRLDDQLSLAKLNFEQHRTRPATLIASLTLCRVLNLHHHTRQAGLSTCPVNFPPLL